ncbi:MDIS1-interacting receptor like kinase 2 [Camellia lanceoleosa]|uniref:MDIS1-interacting receptor like kinase 2 n=1 Tax=Camellia lanceoleosa TaxID=1840588 RepID=A0ACC0J1J1_9ERIC|nr:MDIS1-interacting receptor like kinase 2 [Camellia lanceoleosa]
MEAKALRISGWWSGNISSANHCELEGITCNEARSVTRIGLHLSYTYLSRKLEYMNWTSLPNLEFLNLSHCFLAGIISDNIGSLSKLTSLDLSSNSQLEELAYTMVVTKKSEVYSFGVVALETIMGKHPRELLSSLASLSAQNIMLSDVLDSRLPYPTNPTVIRNIVLAAALGFACVHSEPRSRPTMLFVSQELLVCKKTLATPFRVISLQQILNPEMDFTRIKK